MPDPQNVSKRSPLPPSPRRTQSCREVAETTLSTFYGQFGSTVKIIVGPKAQTFIVHRAKLTSTSEYFRAALDGKGQWKESDEGVFILDDVDPGFFAIFIHWAYTKELSFLTSSDTRDQSCDTAQLDTFVKSQLDEIASRYPDPETLKFWSAESSERHRTWARLATSYILGDRLQCSSSRNAVIDVALGWIKKPGTPNKIRSTAFPSCDVIRYTFDRTPPKSQIRALLLSFIYWRSSRGFVRANICSAQHPDFVVGLAQQLADYEGPRTAAKPEERGGSEWIAQRFDKGGSLTCQLYHEHDTITTSKKRPHSAVEP